MRIVIPSRKAENVVPCVQSILARDPAIPRSHIVVIDDGLDRRAHAALSGVTFLPGRKPFVFARNVNIGLTYALDDAIVLNDDTLLSSAGGFTSLDALAKCLGDDVGMIAPACNLIGNPNQRRHSAGRLRIETLMLCFVAVYIPRTTQQAVGLLDETFIHYGFDDDDYSRRTLMANKTLYVWDGCFVDHSRLAPTFAAGARNCDPETSNWPFFRDKYNLTMSSLEYCSRKPQTP